MTSIVALLVLAGATRPAGAAEGDDSVPTFVVVCAFDHAAPDDPIVAPGVDGGSHSHDFFGATGVDENSTNSSVRAGGTTCALGADKAAYWAPSLKVGGVIHRPDHLKAYYVKPTSQAATPFPADLRIVAGNAANQTFRQSTNYTYWRCKDPDHTDFAFAPGTQPMTPPATQLHCEPGRLLVLTVNFPSCSNGSDDSADHKSHMAYRVNGVCPASHPHSHPDLSIHVHYRTGGGPDAELSSGTPWSGHADFMNGWDQTALQSEMTACFANNQCNRYFPPNFYGTTPRDEDANGLDDDTGEVLDVNLSPPSFTQSATVSDTTPKNGQTISGNAAATGNPQVTLAWQWQRCGTTCADISGATGRFYTVGLLDVNKQLRVKAIASSKLGTAASYSSKTAQVTL